MTRPIPDSLEGLHQRTAGPAVEPSSTTNDAPGFRRGRFAVQTQVPERPRTNEEIARQERETDLYGVMEKALEWFKVPSPTPSGGAES